MTYDEYISIEEINDAYALSSSIGELIHLTKYLEYERDKKDIKKYIKRLEKAKERIDDQYDIR